MVAIVLWTLLLKVLDSLDAREPCMCILDLSFVFFQMVNFLDFCVSIVFPSVKRLVLFLIKNMKTHDPTVCLKVVYKHMTPIFLPS